MRVADIDLTKAAEAMGLDYVPTLVDKPTLSDDESVAGVPIDGSGRIFIDFLKAINTDEYHPIHDDLIDVLGWDRNRPYRDFLRWILAHEMGHLLQEQLFGSEECSASYMRHLAPIQKQIASLNGWHGICGSLRYARHQLQKAYRQIPWEADADLTAEQYWHLIEIA